MISAILSFMFFIRREKSKGCSQENADKELSHAVQVQSLGYQSETRQTDF